MPVPTRAQTSSILRSLDPPVWHVRHSRAVAEVAAWLAARANVRSLEVDREIVEAAALLHDVDKLLPRSDPAAALPHGDAGAAWLSRLGWPELGPAVAGHPVTRLVEPGADRWLAEAPLDVRLVAYADKRAEMGLVSMAARFAGWARRYPDAWDAATARAARDRARGLEADVCSRLAIFPADVRRLRWTRSAWPAVTLATAALAAAAVST